MRWLITNRNIEGDGFGTELDVLTYWTLKSPGLPLNQRSSWENQTVDAFKALLIEAANRFAKPTEVEPKDQKHVCLFIHGYNVTWQDAMGTYGNLADRLFDGPDSLGEVISFDWPSKGSLLGYLPDRGEARQTGDDLTEVLSDLYDWMSQKQTDAARNPDNACRAKTSIIAHSMGNYVLEYAMNSVWTRKNRPLLVSLLQEVLMVAADVDNDLFGSGETVTHGDGEGLANLAYRITALYTGRDSVLGASAGLKHFGKRRLGRAGLDRTYLVPDNVWEIDFSSVLAKTVSGLQIHSEYFAPAEAQSYSIMRSILQGVDRAVLIDSELIPPNLPRVQMPA